MFNDLMGIVRHRLTVGFVLLGLVVAVPACGRSGFQYIESDDSTVFAKIPEEWEILSEGAVDFTLTGEDGQFAVLPDERTVPWRALFDENPSIDGSTDLTRVLGLVEVQPVDRRLRTELSLASILGFDPNDPDDEVELVRWRSVRQGDLSGVRVVYTRPIEGMEATIERLVLTDDRFTVVYELRLGCSRACFTDNAEVIDEIMDTFTVEVG